MKYLKLHEDFDFGEEDFDFEEEDETKIEFDINTINNNEWCKLFKKGDRINVSFKRNATEEKGWVTVIGMRDNCSYIFEFDEPILYGHNGNTRDIVVGKEGHCWNFGLDNSKKYGLKIH